jgi:hypothetical protein
LAINEVTYFPFKTIIVNQKSFDDVILFKFQGLHRCPSVGDHDRTQTGVGMIQFKSDIHEPWSELILEHGTYILNMMSKKGGMNAPTQVHVMASVDDSARMCLDWVDKGKCMNNPADQRTNLPVQKKPPLKKLRSGNCHKKIKLY